MGEFRDLAAIKVIKINARQEICEVQTEF